ncbi:polysaccharide biosynthesis protein [Planktomarina sp.]|nr:polysaccharide biosynthesis protein [Planktomarina sp.]
MKHKFLPFIDFFLINFSFFFCGFLLKLDSFQVSASLTFSILFILCCKLSGFYKIAIRYVGVALLRITLVSAAAGLFLVFLTHGFFQAGFYVFSGLFSLCCIVFIRLAVREFYFLNRHVKNSNTLVYGAGSAGIQFVTAALQGNKNNIIGYVDDSANLIGSSIHGRKVFPTSQIEKLVTKYNVEIIVIAMPSLSGSAKRSIIDGLIELPVRVVTVPTLDEILDQGTSVLDTHDINVEDLLGRDVVPADVGLVQKRISGKTILVTGAGGSIGSEICLQISQLDAGQLILLDVSEPALFEIEQVLTKITDTKLIFVLGSVLDTTLLHKIFQKYCIDTVFHAAAYKHVPLVEDNQLSALTNNVFGTINVLAEAVKENCTSFTLVSTDKAVRPTNVMGATKRLAELACQATVENSGNLIISMVRFGNVLGSSGSVIPTFRKQIASNGPVTVTHRDITRYFMTIPEAAQLVIQSSGMAIGGDVFILDMGEQIKIYDLAKRMIRLSGKNHHDANSPARGDSSIEIQFTGLRPGEKLYEELLIDASALKTGHPKILRAKENFLNKTEIENYLNRMKTSLVNNDYSLFYSLLVDAETGYTRTEK